MGERESLVATGTHPAAQLPLDTVLNPFTRNLRRTMGMKELSQKERNALNNVCAVLGTAFEGAAKVIDEARVLAVLKENNMDVNVAYDLLHEDPRVFMGSPWETNAKKEPKKKAPPAPKMKSRGDGPRDGDRPRSDRAPASMQAKMPMAATTSSGRHQCSSSSQRRRPSRPSVALATCLQCSTT